MRRIGVLLKPKERIAVGVDWSPAGSIVAIAHPSHGHTAVVPGEDGTLRDPRVRHPAAIGEELFLEVVARAVTTVGVLVDAAVFAVPDGLTEGERRALRQVGGAVGVEVLDVIDRSRAAALGAGAGGRVAVYELDSGGFRAGVIGGDHATAAVGLDDVDRAVAARIGGDAGAAPEALLDAAMDARRRLADAERTEIALALPDGSLFRRALTRDELATWIDEALAPAADACRALGPVDAVVIAGAAGRSPAVRAHAARALGAPVRGQGDPAHLAATGAALHARAVLDDAADVPVNALVSRYRARQ